MKKVYALIMGILLVPALSYAGDPAVEFVNGFADDMINNVLKSDKTSEEKLQGFQKIFHEVVDLKSVGQFVLGIYWKNASEADRAAFLDEFVDFTTKTWADRFDSYTGQKIVFSGSRNAERNQLYVDSQIQNNPPVAVIWRLRQKDGSYKVIDIIVEGVSMAMSYRNEYTAFLQKNNGKLNVLTQELKTKAAAFKFSDTKK
ncbi:MAG: ABC transporter substrate-binding protein [Lactobacillales bacterium]|jgi:phospholipid transport system substrate-binding protein|nr:ABC transporter substrate-binding protein [Lactobacillales bacterium]